VRFSCLHLSEPDLQIPLPCLQSHIPPDPRLSVFPSVADKTSFPFLPEFLFRIPLHQILCKFKFISSSASVHPIPIFSFLTARSPRQFLLRSVFPANCPDSRDNNTFFGTHLLHLALSPCHVSPSTSPPLVLPPTICCYLAAAAASNLLHHQPHSCTTHTHPSPLF
jgi:hypothetical protein